MATYRSAVLQGAMHAEIAWEMPLVWLQHNTLLLVSGILLLVMQSPQKGTGMRRVGICAWQRRCG